MGDEKRLFRPQTSLSQAELDRARAEARARGYSLSELIRRRVLGLDCRCCNA